MPGNVLTVTCEGTRPLVVEIQALVAPTSFGLPRRTSSGFDLGRLHLLLAVLERRAGILFGQADVFLNVVGGVRLGDPSVDLGVALALAGAARDKVFPADTVALGEVGLGGEVRRASRLDVRLAEAQALGQRAALVPEGRAGQRRPGCACSGCPPSPPPWPCSAGVEAAARRGTVAMR